MGKKRETMELPSGRLWPNTPWGNPIEIPVFGATGEFQSGKTVLGHTIAPGVHPEGHPFAGKARTLVLDFEESSATYAGSGCERIDVPAVMRAASGGKDYASVDVFKGFLAKIETTEPGRYDVIVADPITDIESGLVEYVKENCQRFGLTPEQIRKASGLLWGAVKDYWKQVLLKLSTRCKCFYFTSHMRDVWRGDQPVPGQREPKGKETLMELACLYLWLERKPDEKGNVPAVPSARVLKERLADMRVVDGSLMIANLLPPRLPVATVQSIRAYIARPANYAALTAEERVPETKFSDQDRLTMELQRAEAERDTEANRLERLRRMSELQQPTQSCPPVVPTGSQPKPSKLPPVASVPGPVAPKPPIPSEAVVLATPEQIGKLKMLMPLVGVSDTELSKICRERGVHSVPDMLTSDAETLISHWSNLAKVVIEGAKTIIGNRSSPQ